ncbi:unnamed protein product [Rotaria sordida]|uniref:Uncharacterized protein n=1 Tax=Rotaria sordida TaxID=392033 RepID=A0A814JBI7_9BILA|nr:unnamed protein product [Rotaria sordida]
MLNKYDVLTMLKKNFNENVNRNAADTDLMFNYRQALHGKVHTVLKNKPDALLFQLYIDEKSLTNPIVEDLNVLQTTGVFIPTLGDYLNFAFTVLAGNHLASNDIGGFQKNFNTGEFCRHCHVNYDQKLVPLNQISHPCRMRDQHDNIVQQIINSNNNIVLRGVVDASPLANLIGFHAVIFLPNDLMHDFNEGVCGQLLMAMLKEASTKRILAYSEIESRLLSFEYGINDKSNKPPVIRKKHLNKGKIVGTASQQMLLFKLFPIIFYDIIDRLETKEIYICLREIVSLVFACPFRKSWLSYLQSLSIRFQCLMVHLLPQLVTAKVHFVTDYAKQIEMNGPAIRHWCMRFESKHQVFKQLAVKSNNFKNIRYTLSKRNQMHQCHLLSFSNYYTIVNEGYSLLEREFYTLPIHVRKLLEKYVEYIDHTTKIMEYQRLKFNHCAFLGEDIDGETLFNLPQSMVYEIIKPLRERVRFLTEHHALFHGTFRNNSDQTTSDKCNDNLLDSSSQSLIEECNFVHVTTQSTGALAKNYQGDTAVFDSLCNSDNINEETSMPSKEDDNKENNDDDEESFFPNIYVVPDLPPKLQQIIQKCELNEFRSHTNVRRLLLDIIFNHVTNEYSLLYPNKDQYKSMGKAILKTLNILKDKETLVKRLMLKNYQR